MATLSNETSSAYTYVSVFDGKLVQRVPEGTEGAVSRPLTKGANAGKLVWEKTYSQVVGKITGGEVSVKEFSGKKVREVQIRLDYDLILQLPMSLLSYIAKPLPNIDLTKEVSINVYKNKNDRAGLNIKQDGQNCEWAFSKENPMGLPPAVKDEMDEWDFKAHDAFLIKLLNETLPSMENIEDNRASEEESDLDENGNPKVPW